VSTGECKAESDAEREKAVRFNEMSAIVVIMQRLAQPRLESVPPSYFLREPFDGFRANCTMRKIGPTRCSGPNGTSPTQSRPSIAQWWSQSPGCCRAAHAAPADFRPIMTQ
jgi:hypothetical protein